MPGDLPLDALTLLILPSDSRSSLTANLPNPAWERDKLMAKGRR